MTYKFMEVYNITSDYTINKDGIYLVNPDVEESDLTLTLPPSDSGKIKEFILVKNIGQGVNTGCSTEYFDVTITTQGSDNINNTTEIQLSNNESTIIVSSNDGNYYTIG